MDKKIKITYTVCRMDFTAETSDISTAYEYVKAIVMRENISFPNQDETLSGYMEILVDKMRNGGSHSNHIFKIEVVEGSTKNG